MAKFTQNFLLLDSNFIRFLPTHWNLAQKSTVSYKNIFVNSFYSNTCFNNTVIIILLICTWKCCLRFIIANWEVLNHSFCVLLSPTIPCIFCYDFSLHWTSLEKIFWDTLANLILQTNGKIIVELASIFFHDFLSLAVFLLKIDDSPFHRSRFFSRNISLITSSTLHLATIRLPILLIATNFKFSFYFHVFTLILFLINTIMLWTKFLKINT